MRNPVVPQRRTFPALKKIHNIPLKGHVKDAATRQKKTALAERLSLLELLTGRQDAPKGRNAHRRPSSQLSLVKRTAKTRRRKTNALDAVALLTRKVRAVRRCTSPERRSKTNRAGRAFTAFKRTAKTRRTKNKRSAKAQRRSKTRSTARSTAASHGEKRKPDALSPIESPGEKRV